MKVVLVMVMSVDGKTTKWDKPHIYEWTSEEDQKHYFSLIEKSRVIVMGRKTFDAARPVMKLKPGKLRIVLTKNPKRYEDLAVEGQLEFVNEAPGVLIKRLERRGFKQALLVGGGEINSIFLERKLVDEVWVSVEPLIFGEGNGLVGDEKLDIGMEMMSMERLNEKGTVLLKYRVV